MCCNFVDLNPHTAAVHYPVPEPALLVDESAQADLWSTIDVKACFHNFPVAYSAQDYLGITTQDGLFVAKRMQFGLDTAP